MLQRVFSALVVGLMASAFIAAPIIGGGKVKEADKDALKEKDSKVAPRDKDISRDKSGLDKDIFRDKDVPKGLKEKDTVRDKDTIKDVVKDPKKNVHEGTILSLSGNKFMMETRGKEHSHTLAPTGKVVGTDGKARMLSDLKKGDFVRVTTNELDMTIAVFVEVLTKDKGSKSKEAPDRDR